MADSAEGAWLCCFCGESADYGADFLALQVASDKAEQWFAAHRACFVKSLADDDAIRGGPLFDD
jgi:hypothetical protein